MIYITKEEISDIAKRCIDKKNIYNFTCGRLDLLFEIIDDNNLDEYNFYNKVQEYDKKLSYNLPCFDYSEDGVYGIHII